MELSNLSEEVIFAYKKGYRVINGKVYSPFRIEPLNPGIRSKDGYQLCYFSFRGSDLKPKYIPVHRLVAYQKYGNEMFEKGIEVRHLDNNSLNNIEENIAIGTAVENAADKTSETRMRVALTATKAIRKFSDDEMVEIKDFYKKVKSYKKVMEKYNISSKGTLHYMLNKEYVSTK